MVLLTNRENEGVKILPLSGNIRIFVKGIDPAVASRYATVVTESSDADVVLMRLNAPYEKRKGFMEGIFHQGSLEFSPDSLQSILSVLKKKPAVVGIYLDRPAVIPEIAEHAAALIAHFGTTDEALLDIIFGLAKPTGKLPFEMPSSSAAVEEQLEDVPYDSRDPLFPFGYGLGYDNEPF
jgi:beta-glucosidase